MTRREELEERANEFIANNKRFNAIDLANLLASVERAVWARIIQQIDYRHATVTMDQTTLKEWCMARYNEVKQEAEVGND